MPRFALSSLVAIAAIAALTAGSTNDTTAVEPSVVAYQFTMVSTIDGVPSEALPHDGQCRIWFDGVPAEKQPRATECEHAMWLAQSWGGRVIETSGSTATVVAQFEGRNDFTGVPSEAIPEPGYCRAWLNGLSADQQPQQGDCVAARRTARATGGRVLFIPL